jgi:hypothetical protein
VVLLSLLESTIWTTTFENFNNLIIGKLSSFCQFDFVENVVFIEPEVFGHLLCSIFVLDLCIRLLQCFS